MPNKLGLEFEQCSELLVVILCGMIIIKLGAISNNNDDMLTMQKHARWNSSSGPISWLNIVRYMFLRIIHIFKSGDSSV